MNEIIGTGESASWELQPGTEMRIGNALPATAEVVVKMADGSFIRFPLAMHGEFAIKSMGSVSEVRMVLPETQGLGPRSVE